jgi:hypothetical protein
MALKEEIPPVWVRDQSSRVWGPLHLATLELMVDHGVVTKPFQYSHDGIKFQLAPDDLLIGNAPMPAALAPPVLGATSNAPTGSSAMKAAVMASRAAGQAARALGGTASSGGLPPRAGAPVGAGSAPAQRASATPLPPQAGAKAGAAPVPRGPGSLPPKAGAAPPGNALPKASPSQPGAPVGNRVPRDTRSQPAVVAPPPKPQAEPQADGGMNLDAMLKDISEFKHRLPSDVLAEARKAAGLPDLSSPAAPPPPPPPSSTARSFQAAPRDGRLEEVSGLRLYYLILAADAGGLLTLGEGNDEVRLWFKQGAPQAVQSASQGLGPFLVEHGAVSRDVLEEALKKSPGDPVSFLFASGKVNPSAAFPLIQQHSLGVLQRALLLERGPFSFDPDQPVPASGFPLGNRWEILVGAARRLDTMSLERWLAGRENHVPRLNGSTAELKLTALELRLVSAMDGTRTLAELVAGSPAEADAQHRVIVLLQELDRLAWQAPADAAPGAVPRSVTGRFKVPAGGGPPEAVPRSVTGRFKVPAGGGPPEAVPRSVTGRFKVPPGGGPPVSAPASAPQAPAPARPAAAAPASAPPTPAAAKPPPPVAPPAPARPQPPRTSPPKPAPPRPATGPPAPVIKAEDPSSFLAALQQKNFFERLGFPKSEIAPPQLKNVYFQFAKIYHPDMLSAEASPVQRKQREDILALLNEAYAVLGDDARRKEYLQQLADEEAGLDAVDIEAILRAEEDFQRAVILIRGHKVREGLAMIEECIKLNEKEGEFYAWRGYAKFLLSTDKKAAFVAAMNDVQKCFKLVQRCPPAHLIEANMAKLIGDDETAKKAFKKVIELDPNNTEANRELRLYQQRAKK